MSRQSVRRPQRHIHRLGGGGMKLPTQSKSGVRNKWSYISAPSICLLGVDMYSHLILRMVTPRQDVALLLQFSPSSVVKPKLVLLVHTMKEYRVRGGLAPLILNLRTRQR